MLSKPKEKLKGLVEKVEARSAKRIGDTANMPGLVRKFLICATAKGLLLQPTTSKNQPSNSVPTLIEYKTHTITQSLSNHDSSTSPVLESHGLIGLLTLASSAYLVSITRREQVAQIRGKPIYVITDVAFIPLSSQSDAQSSIDAAQKTDKKKQRSRGSVTSDTETDDDTDAEGSTVGTEDDHASLPETPAEAPGVTDATKGLGPLAQGSSVASDVIKERGKYGRFAERWFSKAGWSASGRAKQGMSSEQKESEEGDDLTREQKRQGLNALPDKESGSKEDAPKELNDAAGRKKEEKEEGEKGVGEKVAEKVEETVAEGIVKTLTPRILRTMRIWLSSRSFYFAYDHDLSRRLAMQEPSSSTLPLFKRFDPLYFWNQHLIQPFIEVGQYPFVLPVIQGFVGQRAFTVGKTPKGEDDKIVDAVSDPGEVIELWERAIPRPETSTSPKPAEKPTAEEKEEDESKDFLLTLVSRRSVKRAGLRYLRRGVDDEGNVANNVESEQMLSSPTWDDDNKVFSLTQVRGSIPLFFSQSPYSFKPIPITYGSEATNHLAFNKHFRNMLSNYGQVQIASLVDKHGTEKSIGEMYEHHVNMTNEGQLPSHGFPSPQPSQSKPDKKPLAFTWFDFHHECRAMNFQNISYLLDVLTPSLDSFSWTESLSSRLLQTQSGVVRTNCMDCLDRTNVVQSAIAGAVLQLQLSKEYNLSIDLSSDPKTQWFNTLWADNGDAISKQYAGTAALKGDFTRTRKRNWTGALNDFSLTLGRYYNNIFYDYFLQTTIDFVLGNGDEGMWEEFETDLMTGDYALDMSRVRQGAVERCVKVVLGRTAEAETLAESSPSDEPTEAGTPSRSAAKSHGDDDEDLISGYTLHTPGQPNTLRSAPPMEECVLLLTNRALYLVRFDWNTEKVGSYERVELGDITGVKRGTYVTSTLGAKNLDEERNVGFVVTYLPRAGGVKRVNTRSLSTEVRKGDTSPRDPREGKGTKAEESKGDENPAEQRGVEQGQEEGTAEKDFASSPTGPADTKESKILAFKALSPRHTATATDTASTRSRSSGKGKKKTSAQNVQDMSEREVVRLITEEVRGLAVKAREEDERKGLGVKKRVEGKVGSSLRTVKEGAGRVVGAVGGKKDTEGQRTERADAEAEAGAEGGEGGQEEETEGQIWQIQEEDIISVAEAKRSTGYLESIGYSLRRLVWS
ncbi:hypothetical protein C1H76_4989 [Elsinoe australis]|uniref:SAC domain-containing protein n=1 Tax=Elsinoe australis TaxID=40998 RepID=A0A4U7AWP7_9PEZI|nr:hypothetical protein C1H76_4989 [Elsinoe australis]